MITRPTDDEIIARGDILHGKILEMWQRRADFTVDGIRYGSQLPETRSGSPHDDRLTKRSEEIVTAAFILGRLGYERVRISTRDADGRSLERPDFDVQFENGDEIGLEVALGSSTNRAKHDSHVAEIEHTIRDQIDADPAFARAFGPRYLTISTSSVLGERDVQKKKQARAMIAEIETFILSERHRQEENVDDPDDGWFGPEYPILHARGATYYSSPSAHGPEFNTMDGGTINPHPETDEVIHILDQHRRKAAGYRTRRTWIVMHLTDPFEALRNTAAAIERSRPEIAPFEQFHLADRAGRLVTVK